MITTDLTLQEIIKVPELKGREYMVDPGVDFLLKTTMGEDYDTFFRGKTFMELKLKEIPTVLSDWNMPSLADGLDYLLRRTKEGHVFYDIWDEKDKEEEPSRKRTGLSAFIVPGKKKFVLVCPGGAYASVCMIAEGYGIAKELNEMGYSAFILQYRVGTDIQQPKQLEDLARALQFILTHAEEFDVDVDDYALMGFSAGAHLAGCFGTEALGYVRYGLPKPGVIMLGYPVITMGEKCHEGSREFLLGAENVKDEELRRLFSIEKQVTDKYPPVYVWQCEGDASVPVENSRMLVEALRQKDISCVYETFPGNAHGWGLGIQTAAEGWLDRAAGFWKSVARSGKGRFTMREHENSRNPILPLDIHIPDSEAHVMPDGKLYLYGSYDDYGNMYCSEKYAVVSTADMRHWNIYENMFSGHQVPWFPDSKNPSYQTEEEEMTEFARKMFEVDEKDDVDSVLSQDVSKLPPLLFAPDCIEKDGTYYLYFCMADASEGVAVSDKPEGPFADPVRLPCSGIDPAIFVDDDGQAYYYWGQFRSHAVKLKNDMVSFETEQIRNRVLTEEEHFFHEGSSVRKIGNLYYSVFADVERGRPTALGYATGTSPLGPFTYRGIIIDNAGCDPSTWNNHGSIECFQGRWYVFYHRSSRNSKLYRRLCAEPITILEDGTIPEVKMTSQGAGEAFSQGEVIMGYQACGLKGSVYIDAVSGNGGEAREALVNIKPGDEVVFRYVKDARKFESLTVKAEGSGCMEVWMDEEKAGEIVVENGRQLNENIAAKAGEYELKLRFVEADGMRLDWIVLGNGR